MKTDNNEAQYDPKDFQYSDPSLKPTAARPEIASVPLFIYVDMEAVALAASALEGAMIGQTSQHAEVPSQFYEAMKDFEAGKVVDLDTALTSQPPSE